MDRGYTCIHCPDKFAAFKYVIYQLVRSLLQCFELLEMQFR